MSFLCDISPLDSSYTFVYILSFFPTRWQVEVYKSFRPGDIVLAKVVSFFCCFFDAQLKNL